MEFENSKYAGAAQLHDRKEGGSIGISQDGFSTVPNHPKRFLYQDSGLSMKTYESIFKNGDNPGLNPRDSEYFTKDLSSTVQPRNDIKEAINSKVRELILREMERQNSAELKANQQSSRQKCYHSKPFTTIQSGRLDSRSNQPRHDLMIDPCCFDRHCSRRKSGTVYEAIIREQREATVTSARKRSESRPESKSSTPSRSRSKGNKSGPVPLHETAPTTRTIWVESNRDLDAWTPRVPPRQYLNRAPTEAGRPVLSPVNLNIGYKVRQESPNQGYYGESVNSRYVQDSQHQHLPATAATGQGGKDLWNNRQTAGTSEKDRLWASKENRPTASPLSPEKISNLKAALKLERSLEQYRPTDLRGRESTPVRRANRLSTESFIAAERSEESLLANATLTQTEVDKLEGRFSVVAQEVKKGLTFLVNTQMAEHKGKEWEQSTDLIQQLESLKAYTKSLELQNREKDVEILNLCVTLQDLSKTTREVLRKIKVRK